jgi:hypothetical protein
MLVAMTFLFYGRVIMLYRGEGREPASFQFHMLVLSLQSFTFAEVPIKKLCKIV